MLSFRNSSLICLAILISARFPFPFFARTLSFCFCRASCLYSAASASFVTSRPAFQAPRMLPTDSRRSLCDSFPNVQIFHQKSSSTRTCSHLFSAKWEEKRYKYMFARLDRVPLAANHQFVWRRAPSRTKSAPARIPEPSQ